MELIAKLIKILRLKKIYIKYLQRNKTLKCQYDILSTETRADDSFIKSLNI